MVLSVAVGEGPNLSLSPQPGQDPHASRYSIPRTLPYFANFKSHTISYKEYCDIKGDYRKSKVQRQISNGNKLQVRGRVVEKRRRAQEIKESRIVANGNAKSISVNDLLDQHLSKLTLGGIRSAASSRKSKRTKSEEKQNKTENPLDSGSDDSMLIRQVHEIEKGTILRKRFTKGPFPPESQESRRAQLEPSIVTLVHTGSTLTVREPAPEPRPESQEIELMQARLQANKNTLQSTLVSSIGISLTSILDKLI
ncbi:hypothetical protein ACHWQZ_G001494 [Mnemiopsis leidyi]